jgi:hypothetical protein
MTAAKKTAAKKAPAKKTAARKPTAKQVEEHRDHKAQAIDTALPTGDDDEIDEDAFKALQDAYDENEDGAE